MPAWAIAGFRVTVNGRVVSRNAAPGTYVTVSRAWRTGDTVRIAMPFRLRVERALDDPGLQSLFYGPVNLVARDPRDTFLECGLYRNAALSGDLLPSLTAVPGKPLHYLLDGVAFAPFFEGTEDPTHVYVRRAEPTVVFGGLDSGVANPVRADGTSLLDDIWAGAPFRGKTALVRRVRATTNAWVVEGLLTAAAAASVVATARAASYQR